MIPVDIDWNLRASEFVRRYPEVPTNDPAYSLYGVGKFSIVASDGNKGRLGRVIFWSDLYPLRQPISEYSKMHDALIEQHGEPKHDLEFSFPCLYPDHHRYCWEAGDLTIRLGYTDIHWNSVLVVQVEFFRTDRINFTNDWLEKKYTEQSS